jgi:hypothetical protein
MRWIDRKYTGTAPSYQWTDDDLFNDLDLNCTCAPEVFAQWLYQIDNHKSKNPGWSYRIEARDRKDGYSYGYLRIYAMAPATEEEYLAQERARKEKTLTELQVEYLRLKSELLSV